MRVRHRADEFSEGLVRGGVDRRLRGRWSARLHTRRQLHRRFKLGRRRVVSEPVSARALKIAFSSPAATPGFFYPDA